MERRRPDSAVVGARYEQSFELPASLALVFPWEPARKHSDREGGASPADGLTSIPTALCCGTVNCRLLRARRPGLSVLAAPGHGIGAFAGHPSNAEARASIRGLPLRREPSRSLHGRRIAFCRTTRNRGPTAAPARRSGACMFFEPVRHVIHPAVCRSESKSSSELSAGCSLYVPAGGRPRT